MFTGKKANSGPLTNQNDVGLWMKMDRPTNVQPVDGTVTSNSVTDIRKHWERFTGSNLSSCDRESWWKWNQANTVVSVPTTKKNFWSNLSPFV